MKYIDAEKLKAKIKQRKANIETYCLQSNHDKRFDVVPEQLSNILSDIDSLQQEQPEVDLEKEIDHYYGMYRKGGKTYDIKDGEECADWKEMGNPYSEIAFARHFYELGRNARKEE